MIQPATYAELPDDIKKSWKEENVEKAFTQINFEGHLEYVIVPKNKTLPVEWWSQRKHMKYMNSSLPPDSWWFNGHYGTKRPPWTE